ncbi:MAG: mannose-1-phosphate guanylyltransferase/mannose-6-phosphate isomerase [Rhodospirillales bacterium]|nr:mannose-1-phosphate guanylyltransferase/mannose-6-phosphate isomerase [Rhodospirillales bacterium]
MICPVILSGGSGTRLWPLSRQAAPKQFQRLLSGRTMIQETAARAITPLAPGEDFAPPIVVCNESHRFVVAEQMRELGITGSRIVLEPVGRNSGPAILAAALLVAEASPATVLWMMAADAAIGDEAALRRAVGVAVAAARAGHVVTFGMSPTAPETGYGYIEQGEPIAGIEGAFRVTRFVEKPDRATAESYLASGRFLWNAGMFVFTAATLIGEFERHAPDVLASVREAVARSTADADFIRLGAAAFGACRNISLDYAVAEKSSRNVVVPASLGWSDVGSWAALWELGTKDAAGNVTAGRSLAIDARGCYVRGEGTLAAVVGLEDVVLVATPDAVLALPRARAQDVKAVLDAIKTLGLDSSAGLL